MNTGHLPLNDRKALTCSSSRYPDILYLNFVWSEEDQARFARDAQRGRYLKCNALINPPPDGLPLFAIQYIGYSSYPTYFTPVESLVVFANEQSYYLATTEELKHTLGLWNKPYKASGPDPEARLNQPTGLWQAPSTRSKSVSATLSKLDPFKVDSPVLLYAAITGRCRAMGEVAPTFTAGELRGILPHPEAPEAGLPLGSTSD